MILPEEIPAAKANRCNAVDRIEWRLMYGEYGTPTGIKVMGVVTIGLLALILYRLW